MGDFAQIGFQRAKGSIKMKMWYIPKNSLTCLRKILGGRRLQALWSHLSLILWYSKTCLLTYLPTYLPTSPYPILVPINKLNAKNATTNLEENARVGMQLHKAKQSILALAVCCPNRERERKAWLAKPPKLTLNSSQSCYFLDQPIPWIVGGANHVVIT
jgi:hypothetical protein